MHDRVRFSFFHLFIYNKGPESATDMPMTVNSKLTHYKIRQISTENKRFKKTDKLLKRCSSAGRQYTLSAKKNFCARQHGSG